jgi:hypothetical protein
MRTRTINRIDINKPLDEMEGFDIHDYLREGRQYELSPRKVATFLRILYKKINELIDDANRPKKKEESNIQVQVNVSQSPSSNLNKNK